MKPEYLALVGVVVGALLGGVSQIIAAVITHLRERGIQRQTVRREAYVEFVTAVMAAYYRSRGVIERARNDLIEEGEELTEEAVTVRAQLRIDDTIIPESSDLELALSKVILAGPVDVANLAIALKELIFDNLMELDKRRPDGKHGEFSEQMNVFIKESTQHAGGA